MESKLRLVNAAASQPLREFLDFPKMLQNLWARWDLIWQLAKRDILGRYRAARLGLVWSVLTPLSLLVTYTFVFTTILQVKWSENASEGYGEFALALFCGMLVYNFFAEITSRSTSIVVANRNYVNKVIFPLEVLVLSLLISALFNMLIGYGVWMVAWIWIRGELPHLTTLWFPLVLIPLCFTVAGLSWALASASVFIRDVSKVVDVILQIMFFATPIFYSIERVPLPYRHILLGNPLTHTIEDARRILMAGVEPDWARWCVYLTISLFVATLGYAFFMKSKRAFTDVI